MLMFQKCVNDLKISCQKKWDLFLSLFLLVTRNKYLWIGGTQIVKSKTEECFRRKYTKFNISENSVNDTVVIFLVSECLLIEMWRIWERGRYQCAWNETAVWMELIWVVVRSGSWINEVCLMYFCNRGSISFKRSVWLLAFFGGNFIGVRVRQRDFIGRAFFRFLFWFKVIFRTFFLFQLFKDGVEWKLDWIPFSLFFSRFYRFGLVLGRRRL